MGNLISSSRPSVSVSAAGLLRLRLKSPDVHPGSTLVCSKKRLAGFETWDFDEETGLRAAVRRV